MAKKTKNPDLHDELNFARFGVISMHSRVNHSVTEWDATFTVQGRTFRIEAVTPKGRPHGIDTDTLIALESLFVARGCPTDNWVHTTAYEVRAMMGLANNGANYKRLRESIRRLYFTTVIVGRKTALAGQSKVAWDNVGVRFFDDLRYRDQQDEGELAALDSNATLSIRLGEQLAQSIRAGVSQVLDGHLLHKLEQPPARALYRVLQAHRRQDDGQLLKELEVPLSEWQSATGLTSGRSDLVRRSLIAAHDELLANHYLESADIQGRGKSAKACYVFADQEGPDPALVLMLRQAGVSVARASALAAKYPDRVEEALRFLDTRRNATGKVRNPGGLVADFLEHPEKYQLPTLFVDDQQRTQEKKQAAKAKVEQAKRKAEQAAEQQVAKDEEKLLEASPLVQWRERRSMLQLMLRNRLSNKEWKVLEDLAKSGEVQAAQLASELVQASAKQEMESQIHLLKERLQEKCGQKLLS